MHHRSGRYAPPVLVVVAAAATTAAAAAAGGGLDSVFILVLAVCIVLIMGGRRGGSMSRLQTHTELSFARTRGAGGVGPAPLGEGGDAGGALRRGMERGGVSVQGLHLHRGRGRDDSPVGGGYQGAVGFGSLARAPPFVHARSRLPYPSPLAGDEAVCLVGRRRLLAAGSLRHSQMGHTPRPPARDHPSVESRAAVLQGVVTAVRSWRRQCLGAWEGGVGVAVSVDLVCGP